MGKTIEITFPNKRRMPKALPRRVDALYEMREARLAIGRQIKAAEKQIAEMRDAEEELAKELAGELRKQGGTKLSGEVATFSPGSQDIFSVEDWDAFYEFIERESAFECLERRPARGALKERIIENGEKVPGVKADKKFSFSLVKAHRS